MTIIIRKVGPTLFLGTIVMTWAVIMIVSLVSLIEVRHPLTVQGTGFAKDWGQVAGLRVLLGVLEAGYFPGCVYLLSCWYTRCK